MTPCSRTEMAAVGLSIRRLSYTPQFNDFDGGRLDVAVDNSPNRLPRRRAGVQHKVAVLEAASYEA